MLNNIIIKKHIIIYNYIIIKCAQKLFPYIMEKVVWKISKKSFKKNGANANAEEDIIVYFSFDFISYFIQFKQLNYIKNKALEVGIIIIKFEIYI